MTLVLALIFLDIIPKAQKTKANTDKWDYIKLNGFCTYPLHGILISQKKKKNEVLIHATK